MGNNFYIGMNTEQINYTDPNGIRQGLWRSWYSHGELWIELTYVNGTINGLWRMWYDNGKLSCEVYFINGVKEGEQILYRYAH